MTEETADDRRMEVLGGTRPVYVLGAGFSRAIHDAMPLTDELGKSIREKLGLQWPQGYEDSSFEEQLTVLSTPLPFLEGHENTARRASAEHITAQLARELTDRSSTATLDSPPNWLLQLVSIWHAEKAVVLTFNYDTLVEHAVTSLLPAVARGESASTLHGSQVVYPAPPAAAAYTFRDAAGPNGDSLRLLKLHGSLNWFWSSGDGSTLVREPYIEGFGEQPDDRAATLGGTRMLDRFLVPPVLSKDSYYNVNLVHMLWRSAYYAVRRASRLTVIGYSMPQGDRIAADLLRQLPDDVSVDIVNWSVGDPNDPVSPLGRAAGVGLDVDQNWSGPTAVADYVASRIHAAASRLREHQLIVENGTADVVFTLQVPGLPTGPQSFIVYNKRGVLEGAEFSRGAVVSGEYSPIGILQHQLPFGTWVTEDFLEGRHLAATLADRDVLHVTVGDREYIAIDVMRDDIGKWPVLELAMAPA